MKFQPISSAPKDRRILLYGKTVENPKQPVRFPSPVVFTGYWDYIDCAWCADGSQWNGPFFEPTDWAEIPEFEA